MPLLSLIVPVHAVQGYLRECLDSILTQSHADLEIVAIDDASPDHCGAILDEFAARDTRVRVVHVHDNVGLGPARNIGLDLAKGEYVWFVDSDDWLADGALRAIATKLTETRPDVLLFDHDRVHWFGRRVASTARKLLVELDEAGSFSLAEHPEALTLLHVVWNKVVRREFLIRNRIRFEPGWYEDLPFTYPVLVAADRMAALPRVCYHYRRRRQDAITRTRGVRHFEVFSQYERVFAHLDAMGEHARPFRAEIFDRMLWHYLVIQSQPDRVPKEAHRAFFRRITDHYQRFQPTDGPAPRRAVTDRLRRRLLATDSYRTFRVLRRFRISIDFFRDEARSFKHHAGGLAYRVARRSRQAVGRAYYWLQRRRPIDPRLAVYTAYWNRGYACNPAAIHASAAELAPDVRGVWIVDRRHAGTMPAGVPYVSTGSLAYYRVLARARWLVNNVNFPDFVVKRPGTVHLQTHHGTPVKVMGLDQGAYPVGRQDMDLDALIRRCDRWDLSLSSNAHSTEAWARAYPCGYETLEYGYPRNDRLALATPDDVAAARAKVGVPPEATVVLYAPTFRDYESGYRSLMDIEELADALGPEHFVLQRAHYFYAGGPQPHHPRVLDVSAYPVVEDLMLAADVLITDYSSVMFDYAVLDRPIVLFTPDWDAYKRTRGVTFDLLAEPPGVVATTQADLIDAFRTGEFSDDTATKARAQFRSRFCYLDDGHAAERVVRRLFLK
jgi:CDP-glycerol glycerophosphotransferase